MRFQETEVAGVFLVTYDALEDERGGFARTFCRREFADRGLDPAVVQCNLSRNREKGTLRGMHLQKAPHGEAKLIRCTRGSVYDVAVDLRRESPTFRRWVARELREDEPVMLYIPQGVAHGFQTLEDDTELFYQMSAFYRADAATGVRWDDPAFGICWPPAHRRIISEKDRSWPDFPPD